MDLHKCECCNVRVGVYMVFVICSSVSVCFNVSVCLCVGFVIFWCSDNCMCVLAKCLHIITVFLFRFFCVYLFFPFTSVITTATD